MLSSVYRSSLLQGPTTLARWFRIAGLGVAALSALLPSAPARAQEADSGWFEAPADDAGRAPEAASQPDYTPPAPGVPAPAPPPQTEVEDTDPSALTTFRPALDPYGVWVTDPNYGTVWVPNRDVVGADFAPYVSRGHWALTADNDWIWASDYPFGWAVFHYGRWVWIASSGWAWVPGRTYANAWVVWRVPTPGYAYVGWAPMPPTWGWRHGYAFSLWYSPPLPYVFCPSAYVFDYRVHYHIVRDRHLVHDIASHTHVYPTPYRAPAQPSARTAASPSARPRRIGPSAAPRGPAMAAARVPAQAIPAVRTAPPASAARLAGSRLGAGLTREPYRDVAQSQLRTTRVRDARDAVVRDSVRSRSPSSSWSTVPRSNWSSAPRSNPSRTSSEPRLNPSRTRVAPSPSRTYSPAPMRSVAPARSIAPMRSVAPVRSFSPSMRGGGSFRRR